MHRCFLRRNASCLAALAALPLLAVPVDAQETVRVVEAVSEATGDYQRYVVRDLDESEIKAVQSALRAEGYVGIGWTSRLDDGTVEGLGRFQRERGLVECGCVSYETIVALGLRPEVVATVSADPGPAMTHDPVRSYGSTVTSGIYYPVGIPIYVPRPPPCDKDPCDGEDGGEDDEDGNWIAVGSPESAPAGTGSGMTATPPGIRPAPPPARSPR